MKSTLKTRQKKAKPKVKEITQSTKKPVIKTETIKNELNPSQELFCQIYAGRLGTYYGNGTQAYLQAYNCEYNTANTNSRHLLANTRILERIRELTQKLFSNEQMDHELMKVALQDNELGAKVSAITVYNRIMGRLKDKVEHSVDEESKEFFKRILQRQKEKQNERKLIEMSPTPGGNGDNDNQTTDETIPE